MLKTKIKENDKKVLIEFILDKKMNLPMGISINKELKLDFETMKVGKETLEAYGIQFKCHNQHELER